MVLADIFQAIILAFSLVFVMEMGDKTQLTAFVLSMRYRSPLKVFMGVLTGLTGVTIIAVVIGLILKNTFDLQILKPLIAAVFLLSGLFIIVTEIKNRNNRTIKICPVSLDSCDKLRENCPDMENCELYLDEKIRKGAFIHSASFMFLAELGDKTLLMGIGLSAQFDPIGVFFGALFALSLVNGIGVFLGDNIAKKIPRTIVGTISGVIFLVTGMIIFLF